MTLTRTFTKTMKVERTDEGVVFIIGEGRFEANEALIRQLVEFLSETQGLSD